MKQKKQGELAEMPAGKVKPIKIRSAEIDEQNTETTSSPEPAIESKSESKNNDTMIAPDGTPEPESSNQPLF